MFTAHLGFLGTPLIQTFGYIRANKKLKIREIKFLS